MRKWMISAGYQATNQEITDGQQNDSEITWNKGRMALSTAMMAGHGSCSFHIPIFPALFSLLWLGGRQQGKCISFVFQVAVHRERFMGVIRLRGCQMMASCLWLVSLVSFGHLIRGDLPIGSTHQLMRKMQLLFLLMIGLKCWPPGGRCVEA